MCNSVCCDASKPRDRENAHIRADQLNYLTYVNSNGPMATMESDESPRNTAATTPEKWFSAEKNSKVNNLGWESAGKGRKELSAQKLAEPSNVIVIDNGSGVIRAGFAGEAIPRLAIPTVVGRPKKSISRIDQKNYYIGEDV